MSSRPLAVRVKYGRREQAKVTAFLVLLLVQTASVPAPGLAASPAQASPGPRLAEAAAASREYDRVTEHGRREGALFPTVQ